MFSVVSDIIFGAGCPGGLKIWQKKLLEKIFLDQQNGV